ncbi:MAG: hypothetical protein M1497_00370 [Nitrospirae bacterium]|nr:hypothetical protein [Nitrospirota bacterium]
MKAKFLSIVSVITLTLLFCAAGTGAFAGKDSEGWTSLTADVSIKKKSIVREPGDTVSLWVRIVPGEHCDLMFDARSRLTAKGRNDLALAYDYTGFLSEIDCSKKKHRELVTILYDVRRNIVDSLQQFRTAWSDIVPGSSFDSVQMAVCR